MYPGTFAANSEAGLACTCRRPSALVNEAVDELYDVLAQSFDLTHVEHNSKRVVGTGIPNEPTSWGLESQIRGHAIVKQSSLGAKRSCNRPSHEHRHVHGAALHAAA